MNKGKDSYLIELESKIQILERENESLSEKAEENLLLNRAFEEINNHSKASDLFINTLESICIILDIQFAGIFNFNNNKYECISSYAMFSNKDSNNIIAEVSELIQDKLKLQKTYFCENNEAKLIFNDLETIFTPTCILFIPLLTSGYKEQCFIFSNDNSGCDLNHSIPFLEKIIHLIASRLEKIEVQNELNELYTELKSSNNKLISTNTELNKKNNIIVAQNSELQDALTRLKETQSQLIQADKMASIGVLTSGIAHEINNPLNFIQGGKTAIEMHLEDNVVLNPSEIKQYIEMIDEGMERAIKIVKGLGRFNRKSDDYNEDCNLVLIIENCLLMMHDKFENIAIKKHFAENLKIIKGNEGELHQVILNLLLNAVHAIKNAGDITISILEKANDIEISIQDTGCGIASEDIKKITDPFFTTKAPGEGTGLGLSIVYSIVQKHCGTLQIESELNKGTKAILSFPC